MSGLLQSGQHPDADQLNAFVEHVLPAHEHEETLAHLAACTDCRAVVALSLPTVEEAMPQPREAHRPWFSGWRLLWPIATVATLAALVVASVHLRNVPTARIAPAAPQVAEGRTPLLVPPKPTGPTESKQKISVAPPVAIQAPPKVPALVAAAKPTEEDSVAVLPLQGRVTTALSGISAKPIARASAKPAAAPPATAGVATGTIVSANGASVSPSLDGVASPAPQSLPQSATVLNYAAQSAPPAGASAATGTTVNSSSMVLQSATAMRSFSAHDLAQAILRAHPLPNGLAALSVVRNARQNQTLAVDTNGGLFITADSGEHWTPVASQWPGRAVKVDVVFPGNVNAAGLGLSTLQEGSRFAPPAGPAGGPVAISSGALPSSLSGSVTDASGATIPGATVIVSSAPTQLARLAKTDVSGHYLIDGLVPGTYSVEAGYPGFIKQQLAGVAVVPGTLATANLTLQVAAATQTVEVSSDSKMAAGAAVTKMKSVAAPNVRPVQPVFEITTETGEHWTSADGLAWKLK